MYRNLLRLVAYLTVGVLAILSGSANAATGCQMVKVASLPLEVTSGNSVIVKGSIKGEPAEFLLDTGGARTLFDNAVVSRFGVARGVTQAHMYGVGGQFEAYKATIPDLMIGDLKGGDLMLWVSATHFLHEGIYGVLGEDFFKNVDLDIDLAQRKFDLFQHYSCKTEPVYWAEKFSEAAVLVRDEKIFVTVEVNGVPARAVLDTGASRTMVSWPLARRLGLDKDSPGMELVGKASGIDRNSMDLYRYRFSELGVGDEVVKNPFLFVSNLFQRKKDQNSMDRIQDSNWTDADLLLGSDFIRSHHLYVATDLGKIYFTWNGGSIFMPPKE